VKKKTGMKMDIRIPAGDWLEEYLREEPDLSTEDALAQEAVRGKRHVRQLARMLIVAQERGDIEGIISPPKTLLNTGGAVQVARILRSRKIEVVAPSGKTYQVRELVSGYVGGPPGAEPSAGIGFEASVEAVGVGTEEPKNDYTYHDIEDERASDLAYRYLETMIRRHIWNHLTILAKHRVDLGPIAKILHDQIDEMVGELTEPLTA